MLVCNTPDVLCPILRQLSRKLHHTVVLGSGRFGSDRTQIDPSRGQLCGEACGSVGEG